MSRLRLFRFAAIIWLPLFSMVAGAQAQVPFTSNAATDWLATFPTTASVGAAASASWGNPANTGGHGIWSGGELSYNWTDQAAGYNNGSLMLIPTYYAASTGYVNSASTREATYTYTVPFQAYQFNPGSTIHQMTGETLTQQLAYNQPPIGGSSKITLPAGMTSGGAASGYVQEVSAVKTYPSATSTIGFSTGAFNPQGTQFNDGTGTVAAFRYWRVVQLWCERNELVARRAQRPERSGGQKQHRHRHLQRGDVGGHMGSVLHRVDLSRDRNCHHQLDDI